MLQPIVHDMIDKNNPISCQVHVSDQNYSELMIDFLDFPVTVVVKRNEDTHKVKQININIFDCIDIANNDAYQGTLVFNIFEQRASDKTKMNNIQIEHRILHLFRQSNSSTFATYTKPLPGMKLVQCISDRQLSPGLLQSRLLLVVGLWCLLVVFSGRMITALIAGKKKVEQWFVDEMNVEI